MMGAGRSFTGIGKKIILIACILVIVFAIAFSALTFFADRLAAVAERVLDDPLTEKKDVIDISEQSIPAYRKAIRALEYAHTLAPLNSGHARSLTDLHRRINVWQATMRTMGADSPEGLPSNKDLREAILRYAKKAVMLDPSNADHIFALGQAYAAEGMLDAALGQWEKAVNAYPVNGAIRYAAAIEMLLAGLQEQAGEQAAMLAATDDSYRLEDDDPAAGMIRERRPPGYEQNLAESYLYKAMEITWRTSARDLKAVMAIVPDNDDAREVARMFLEQKGIEDE